MGWAKTVSGNMNNDRSLSDLLEEINKIFQQLEEDKRSLNVLSHASDLSFPKSVVITPKPGDEGIVKGERIKRSSIPLKTIQELLKKIPVELLSAKVVKKNGQAASDGNGDQTLESYLDSQYQKIIKDVHKIKSQYEEERQNQLPGSEKHNIIAWKSDVAEAVGLAAEEFRSNVSMAISKQRTVGGQQRRLY